MSEATQPLIGKFEKWDNIINSIKRIINGNDFKRFEKQVWEQAQKMGSVYTQQERIINVRINHYRNNFTIKHQQCNETNIFR